VQGRCDVDEPPLEPKRGGGEAACHFPLEDRDVRAAQPAAGSSR
jgi:hypothetical protein